MVHYTAPGHTVVSAQCLCMQARKSVDHERAVYITMQQYCHTLAVVFIHHQTHGTCCGVCSWAVYSHIFMMVCNVNAVLDQFNTLNTIRVSFSSSKLDTVYIYIHIYIYVYYIIEFYQLNTMCSKCKHILAVVTSRWKPIILCQSSHRTGR